MTTMLTSLGLDKLSRDERIALAQELWNSIVAEPGPSLLTEAQRKELLRRADEADTDPDGGIPWEVVKAEGRTRFRS